VEGKVQFEWFVNIRALKTSNQPTNQPTNKQPTNQPTNKQPTNQPTNQTPKGGEWHGPQVNAYRSV